MGYSPYMTYVKYPRPRVSTKDFSGQFSTEWGSTPYIATEAKWNRFIVGTISVRQTCKKELIPELGMKTDSPKKDASIAGQSAEHYIAMDDSLAALLLNHGIKVRDFILLSFLSDQGPMSVARLSRAVGIDPKNTLRSLRRLSTANLVLRDPSEKADMYEAVARLTMRGEEIAQKIISQLE